MISAKTLREVKTLPALPSEPLHWVMQNKLAKQGKDLLWLEFGVWKGQSIKYISGFTDQTIYGFDSFEGLPEYWRESFDIGAFSEGGRMPQVPSNVKLIKGWFENTLPIFLEEHEDKQISFAHLDADLYSSTSFVLSSIAPFLSEGAVLVFDELINFPEFDGDNGELRAWDEFVENYAVDYAWIGGHGPWGSYETCYEKAAVRINGLSV